ncbi:MAG: hypothetical protein ACI942_000279, partial [Planctomycetota bacterium]
REQKQTNLNPRQMCKSILGQRKSFLNENNFERN